MLGAFTIESEDLQVVLLPSTGGKIISLVEGATGEEFLLSPAHAYVQNRESPAFADSDRGGFDECLPSVSACAGTANFPAVPDHGELWSRSWQVLHRSKSEATLTVTGVSGLSLTRKTRVLGRRLYLHYELTNRSDAPRSWIWSSHPLLQVEPGDVILLPSSVTRAKVNSTTDEAMRGQKWISWPIAQIGNHAVRMDVVGQFDGHTAHKLFVEPGPEGWCALYRTRVQRIVRFDFSVPKTPFVGIWICFGAWPEEHEPKQYTVALEPTNADTDSLYEAELSGKAYTLSPGRSHVWEMTMSVLPYPLA